MLAYVRRFHLLAAGRQLSPVDRLTFDEEALFESLVLLWHDRGRITVSDIMRNGDEGRARTAANSAARSCPRGYYSSDNYCVSVRTGR